jgi:hypothetical protein
VLCAFFVGLRLVCAEEILLGEANPYSIASFDLNLNWIRASRASALQDGEADHLAVYFHQAGLGWQLQGERRRRWPVSSGF